SRNIGAQSLPRKTIATSRPRTTPTPSQTHAGTVDRDPPRVACLREREAISCSPKNSLRTALAARSPGCARGSHAFRRGNAEKVEAIGEYLAGRIGQGHSGITQGRVV